MSIFTFTYEFTVTFEVLVITVLFIPGVNFWFQEELLAGYKREGIDATPYYWYTDQVSRVSLWFGSHKWPLLQVGV